MIIYMLRGTKVRKIGRGLSMASFSIQPRAACARCSVFRAASRRQVEGGHLTTRPAEPWFSRSMNSPGRLRTTSSHTAPLLGWLVGETLKVQDLACVRAGESGATPSRTGGGRRRVMCRWWMRAGSAERAYNSRPTSPI